MTTQQTSDLIPITLLTGFLGSGKTTVLNHLITQPELSDALVIVNEFGEIGLDHLLVAHSTEIPVAQMNSGCMCCTIRSDLVKTLRDITWRFSRQGERQFTRVIIETTGLADPAPIINTIMTNQQIASKYKLDGIVTVVDMVNGADTLAKHDEAVKQIALADVLLLTKADLVNDAERAAFENQLDEINALAPRFTVKNGIVSPVKVINVELGAAGENRFGVIDLSSEESDEPHHHEHHHHHHHDETHHQHHVHHHAQDGGINAYCFSGQTPIPEDILTEWLSVLKGFMGDKILRVKGILNVEGHDRPVIVHGVQHILHPLSHLQTDVQNGGQSDLVFITQDVDKAAIEHAFRQFPGVVPSP